MFIFVLFFISLLAISLLIEHGGLVSWENLQHYYLLLIETEKQHPILTPILFMTFYILYTLLSLPGIFLFSLAAGFLFIQPYSTLYVTFSATFGASLLFILVRGIFKNLFYGRVKRWIERLDHGFNQNAASYLLFLRLIPLSPFWMINISGAFLKISLWTFTWTTFIGMIPSVFIYTQAGKELARLLYSPDPLRPSELWNPYLIAALAGLAIMTLLPVFFKKAKRSQNYTDNH